MKPHLSKGFGSTANLPTKRKETSTKLRHLKNATGGHLWEYSLSDYSRLDNTLVKTDPVIEVIETQPVEEPTSISESKLEKIQISRCWRSMPMHIIFFLTCGYMSVPLSERFSGSVLVDTLQLPWFHLQISLPLFVIPSALFLFHGIFLVYNRYADMDDKILRLHTGVMSLRTDTIEMDIPTLQVVQVSQTPIQRLLGVGTLSVARFSRKNMEFYIQGVPSPNKLAKSIKRRIKKAREHATQLAKTGTHGEDLDDHEQG